MHPWRDMFGVRFHHGPVPHLRNFFLRWRRSGKVFSVIVSRFWFLVRRGNWPIDAMFLWFNLWQMIALCCLAWMSFIAIALIILTVNDRFPSFFKAHDGLFDSPFISSSAFFPGALVSRLPIYIFFCSNFTLDRNVPSDRLNRLTCIQNARKSIIVSMLWTSPNFQTHLWKNILEIASKCTEVTRSCHYYLILYTSVIVHF